MAYHALLLVHVVSATVLFGTGIGTAFQMLVANRRRDTAAIYHTARTVVIADWIFTTPAVVVQLATGVALVRVTGHRFAELWITAALALFVLAGACWLPVVWLQIRMRDIAQASLAAGESLPARYWTLARWWTALGAVAFPAVLAIFYLMVFEPQPS